MTKAKRVRWVCGTCGKGALGPTRPRADATVRFCLVCSAKSDRLVERTCPALDKKRAARMVARKARQTAQKAREDAKWTVAGVDVRQFIRDAVKLPVWRERFAALNRKRSCPKGGMEDVVRGIWVQLSLSGKRGHYRGAAWSGSRKIKLVFGKGLCPSQVGCMILHELTHLVVADDPTEGRGGRGGRRRSAHSTTFYAELFQAAHELYGISGTATPEPGGAVYSEDRYLEKLVSAELGEADKPTEKPRVRPRMKRVTDDGVLVLPGVVFEELVCSECWHSYDESDLDEGDRPVYRAVMNGESTSRGQRLVQLTPDIADKLSASLRHARWCADDRGRGPRVEECVHAVEDWVRDQRASG